MYSNDNNSNYIISIQSSRFHTSRLPTFTNTTARIINTNNCRHIVNNSPNISILQIRPITDAQKTLRRRSIESIGIDFKNKEVCEFKDNRDLDVNNSLS